jgi:glycosyltransferase involved in cell wall biosynthesis
MKDCRCCSFTSILRPVRILQITSARALGGGETHFLDLVNGLHRRRHEVHVVLSPRSPLRTPLEHIPEGNIFSLPLRNALDASSAHQLARIVREREIEIIHAHMARDYPLAAFAAARNKNARIVITRHVLFPMSRLHAVTLANVSRVIAVSEAVARELRQRSVFAPGKIVVVRNGIDVERFARVRADFDPREFCHRMKIPDDRVLVGTVGEITKLKGHEDFVRAAALIAARVPDAHFIVAGDDQSRTLENEKSLKKLIEEHGLTARVQRFGWLDNLAELYSALDIFVSASHSESFGLAIVEAMASSGAVVATATDGAREVIEDGISGKIVPIADPEALASAVVDLAEDAEERKRYGTAAQLRAREKFGFERMLEETEQVYRDALGAV